MKNLKDYTVTNKIILKNRKFLAVITGCFLFLSICWIIWHWQIFIPVSNNTENQTFIIKSGESLEQVSENLESKNLIRNRLFFIFYTYLKGTTKNIQAGKYELNPNLNIPQIVTKFVKGDISKDWINVTILEGWTNEKIEEKLYNLGLIDKTDMLGINLQGYLFPDTYYFEKGWTVQKITDKMISNFNKQISNNLVSAIENQGKTLYQVLIMASILEKEVATYQDMRIVSDIFWKRIARNYPLQSCATIAYALGKNKWIYSYEDVKVKSSYNTYINTGLPPTPINNPGLLAIQAAVYPDPSPYNFFLSDPDTGETIFSKTVEEHNANKIKYFK